jgi:L-methionine (R)-S-oxide reductase
VLIFLTASLDAAIDLRITLATTAPMTFEALSAQATPEQRLAHYQQLQTSLLALLEGEDDWIAALSTLSCELHHAFEYFHWTGFYRAVSDSMLVIGPYQGGHGCLRIPFGKGVCGTAARTRITQLVPDVNAFPGHIACSSATQSELVVPIVTPQGRVLGVLDIDSNLPDVFTSSDQIALEHLCAQLGTQFANITSV